MIYLALHDEVLVFLDALLLLVYLAYNYLKFSQEESCLNVKSTRAIVKPFRVYLYLAIHVGIGCAYVALFSQSYFSILFHLVFVYSLFRILTYSLPAWLCKLHHFASQCNCDVYPYQDFYISLGLGVLAGLIVLFAKLFTFTLLYLLLPVEIALIYLIINPPKKKNLFYIPHEFLLKNMYDIQNFLIMNPQQLKIITFVDRHCQFCQLQVDIYESLPEAYRSYVKLMYEDLLERNNSAVSLLNISPDDMKLPYSVVFANGMFIDVINGIVTEENIVRLISNST